MVMGGDGWAMRGRYFGIAIELHCVLVACMLICVSELLRLKIRIFRCVDLCSF